MFSSKTSLNSLKFTSERKRNPISQPRKRSQEPNQKPHGVYEPWTWRSCTVGRSRSHENPGYMVSTSL